MFKQLIMLIFMCVPCAFSAMGTNYFNEEVTPKQSYQSAEDHILQRTAVPVVAQAVDTTQADVLPPKATEPTVTSTEQPPATIHAVRSVPFTTTPEASSENTPEGGLKLLQAQLDQVNQNFVLNEQQMSGRLSSLRMQTVILSKQIKEIQQVLVLLNQEMQKKSAQVIQAQTLPIVLPEPGATNPGWLQRLVPFFGVMGAQVLSAGSLLLVLLACILWFAHARSKRVVQSSVALSDVVDDTKDEYDYMGSAESIPAQLNLARTYIAMDDFVAAERVLAVVLSLGDESQKGQASALLAGLSKEQ